MEKGIILVIYAMILYLTVLDHILTVHHQELHLNNSDSFSSSDLLGMLENLNVEILPEYFSYLDLDFCYFVICALISYPPRLYR